MHLPAWHEKYSKNRALWPSVYAFSSLLRWSLCFFWSSRYFWNYFFEMHTKGPSDVSLSPCGRPTTRSWICRISSESIANGPPIEDDGWLPWSIWEEYPNFLFFLFTALPSPLFFKWAIGFPGSIQLSSGSSSTPARWKWRQFWWHSNQVLKIKWTRSHAI